MFDQKSPDSKINSLKVPFLKIKVNTNIIIVDGLNIASLLLLAPIFLDLLLFCWIIDGYIVAIGAFLD